MTRLSPSPDNVGHGNKNTDDESEREDEEEQSPITMEHNGGQSSENTDGKNKDKHGKTNVEPEQNRLLKLLDWLIRGTGEEKKDKKEVERIRMKIIVSGLTKIYTDGICHLMLLM